MEPYTLTNDIEVFYVRATTFPEGIKPAFEKLVSLLPSMAGRHLYGISRPENNQGIVYRAAVNAKYPGEGAKYGCESFTIRKGTYMTEVLKNYEENMMQVSQTFDALLEQPHLDPQGYCLEEYINDTDMRCMVPLKAA
ncbi:transcriptional regulator [Chitinophaga arvensicola]|uniref:GyrI-like small molecule binding domain-containing protein n=1 Tax=Chitinophaga arvensicola TaxID=29529 RepID=A0A1I0REK3_9BACT|nr:transcriptional regulator [Chitinophaga arvensicola]SEW39278.1 hypothetical protein SAMN04488122_2725 [Chitinophaga arvensicola]